MRRNVAGWLRFGVSVVLVAMVSAACGSDDATLSGAVRNPPLKVTTVALPDVGRAGEPVMMKAPPFELYLVYFGYTTCPDICPTTLSDIRVALEDLPDGMAERVTVAMVTVDPERDTDEVLTGYLGHFFDHSLALRSTDPDELQAAGDAFGVQWQIEDHAPGEPYAVAHTSVTYVVDDDGTVVVEWPFGLDSAAMTSDLRTLLREEQPT